MISGQRVASRRCSEDLEFGGGEELEELVFGVEREHAW
jgi:hypothetical protein